MLNNRDACSTMLMSMSISTKHTIMYVDLQLWYKVRLVRMVYFSCFSIFFFFSFLFFVFVLFCFVCMFLCSVYSFVLGSAGTTYFFLFFFYRYRPTYSRDSQKIGLRKIRTFGILHLFCKIWLINQSETVSFSLVLLSQNITIFISADSCLKKNERNEIWRYNKVMI